MVSFAGGAAKRRRKSANAPAVDFSELHEWFSGGLATPSDDAEDGGVLFHSQQRLTNCAYDRYC